MLKQTLLLSCIFACGVSMADDVQLMGTETRSVTLPQSQMKLTRAMPQTKTITLMNIKLSGTAQEHLLDREQAYTSSSYTSDLNLPRAKQLGMAGVPVLDQGSHGSCVTFATTAAIDAAVFKSDAISQLCQLELGAYLEKVGNNPSGWDGSFGHIVLNQMDTFGIITKDKQQSEGCAGLKDYPSASETPTNMMTPEEFHQMIGATTAPHITWFPILHVNEALSIPVDSQRILNKVKEAIHSGDRVAFGSLLVDPEEGVAGAIGTYHQSLDTWVLTSHLRYDMEHTMNFAGHEMVITGYDDDAVAKDADGGQHKGLLTLRNSWGANIGDKGNFYMSYDYFKSLVIEAHQIRTV